LVEIIKHDIFKEANTQMDWLNKNIHWYHCDKPCSYLVLLSLYGGKYNCGKAANIWYGSKRIDLYDIKILDKMKEFALLFGYEVIDVYESK
jgi:hypothetical protein